MGGFGSTYLKNFAVNSATGGIGSKGRWAARAAAWATRQSIEVGAETAFDAHVRGIDGWHAFGYNLVGSLGGEAIFAGVRFGARRVRLSRPGLTRARELASYAARRFHRELGEYGRLKGARQLLLGWVSSEERQ